LSFNLFYISPELILAGGGILVLAVGLACRKRSGVPWPEIVCLLVLLTALIPSAILMTRGAASVGRAQFGGMMAMDGFALFFKLIAIVSTLIVAVISTDYFHGIRFDRGEYYALLIFATLAITCLAASTDLIMIYLSIEFLSLTSYVLAGYLKRNPKSNEAAVKYFMYGSVASAVMLYGMSMLYGITGTTNILSIAGAFKPTPGSELVMFLSLIMILVGFGFKIAMVPFHQWSPDTYEGAPTPITAFLSVASKAAGFAILVRVLGTGIKIAVVDWRLLIAILAALTMTVGNLIAISQINIKRMLAYSSIAQAGYLLIGLVAMPSADAVPAIQLYLLAYLFMNLGAFAVVTMLGTRLKSDNIRDYAGLIKRSPFAAFAMVFFMLSLAGIPPTAGFLGKFYLFWAAIQSGYAPAFVLAIVAIVNTVISLYYYMNIVRVMFFVPANERSQIAAPPSMSFVIGLTVTMTIVVLIYASPFITLLHTSMRMLEAL
jgi:proton-translocating NADH-quinone oxidoreductase chain N